MDQPRPLAPDDVLAQPTRAQLFDIVQGLHRPASTAELAERLELHPNGIRLHLERMESAGLLLRERRRQDRGRPIDVWTVAPTARPGGSAPDGYRELGRWLARAMREHHSGPDGLERTGEDIGRELAPTDGTSGPEALRSALSALGFQPELTAEGARLTVCLGNCPYRDAVRENQPAICALHRGITRGLLAKLEPDARLTRFVPHNPDEAGCTIEIVRSSETAAP